MIGLYFFGRDVGRLFGGARLLALYVAGGVVGSLAHCGWYYYKACQTGEEGVKVKRNVDFGATCK